jgi:hypothetical protein
MGRRGHCLRWGESVRDVSLLPLFPSPFSFAVSPISMPRSPSHRDARARCSGGRHGDAGRLERLGIDVHHLHPDEHDPAAALVPSRKVHPPLHCTTPSV